MLTDQEGGGNCLENTTLSNKHSALIIQKEASWGSLLRLRKGQGGGGLALVVVLPVKKTKRRGLGRERERELGGSDSASLRRRGGGAHRWEGGDSERPGGEGVIT